MKSADTFSFYGYLAQSASLLSLLYRWNSTIHTFFKGCQEVFPSLEDVYEVLRLPLFGDGEVANISLSSNEAKAMKFLEDVVKKTLKKLILKAARKEKAPARKCWKTPVLVVIKAPKPTFGDGSNTSGGSMLMV